MAPFTAYAYLDIDHPMVAWEVYRGVIVSQAAHEVNPGPVSLMFAGLMHARNVARFNNELTIERVRAHSFPEQVSRLEAIYLFEKRDEAMAAEIWGAHFTPENLASLGVRPQSPVCKVDANWITYAPTDAYGYLLDNDLAWIERYWSGIAFNNTPVWELLCHGRAHVLSKNVRQRAYDKLMVNTPQVRETLEISRLAAFVDSDLGHVTPWLTKAEENRYVLDYYMNFEDAKNTEVLRQMVDPAVPRNWKDLPAGWDGKFTVPDLREYGIEFELRQGYKGKDSRIGIHHN